jgi:NTE family protein
VRSLKRRDVLAYIDVALGNGGFVQGRRLMAQFHGMLDARRFSDLQRSLGVVATDLYSGQERWLRDGDLDPAIRASMALPGVFTPVQLEGEWLVDGGLVNPVPVSLCHAMGADRVIAVNLSGGLVGRRIQPPAEAATTAAAQPAVDTAAMASTDWWQRLTSGFRDGAETLQAQFRKGDAESAPGVFDVIATAVNVMQDRITRSRIAGDPPDVLIAPGLAHIDLLELHRGDEAIAAGAAAVDRMRPAIEALLQD